MADTCKRCGKAHPTRDCKATLLKSWPWRDKMKLKIVIADGSWQEIETPLTSEQKDAALALFLSVCETAPEETTALRM